jgi:hypothetical protein
VLASGFIIDNNGLYLVNRAAEPSSAPSVFCDAWTINIKLKKFTVKYSGTGYTLIKQKTWSLESWIAMGLDWMAQVQFPGMQNFTLISPQHEDLTPGPTGPPTQWVLGCKVARM